MQVSKAMKYIALQISDAVSRWAGWALAYPEFGNSVTNPIPTRGAGYAHHITPYPSGFQNLKASLQVGIFPKKE